MLEFLYIVGAFASIISIIVNVVQWQVNRALKRSLESTVCIGENALANIERDTKEAMSKHPADQSECMKAILAHAETGRTSLSHIRRKELALSSRR